MSAEIVKIKCPQCGTTLKLGIIPDLERKKVMCPRCKFTGMVAEYQPADDAQPEPEPAPGAQPKTAPGIKRDPATRLNPDIPLGYGASPNLGAVINRNTKKPLVGKLRDASGMEYPLSFGINTLGRNAPTSPARIRVPDCTHRVSREHLIFEVKMAVKPGGNTVMQTCIISPDDNKVTHIVRLAKPKVNATFLNDMQMVYGFEYILKTNDKIRLPGGSIITFVL